MIIRSSHLLAVGFFVLGSQTFAQDIGPQEPENLGQACNCKEYPFTPNPPCYHFCVTAAINDNRLPLSEIKGLDRDTLRGIAVLRQQRLLDGPKMFDDKIKMLGYHFDSKDKLLQYEKSVIQ